MMKNGENRQFDITCPFDCTKWDECLCENTAAIGQVPFFGTAEDMKHIEERAGEDVSK